ncbi:hypothetical protein BN7_2052 [Wickerhamomyces ciferrii]|uniref:Ubiquitin-like domain-containing protein n=1 Tax=Wickerhamomyces ciferrii (strain ATCC 14091 / BCRC 22168 / CBS 111 / JCM 3599 / NBRC 0793 / NRRL Y-1031 F-60-10) TaxID=1206466 RepID=K0KN04_WICCF|nr:uncharacterized protein BN7_2052 [Wickerhamomyces ciferrii]CCH42508.1 hypothetical protein BN7_2052 [Wickerhamomyces ciferrii]
MSTITLLFLNTHRETLQTSKIPSNIPLLKKYLLENWSNDFNNLENPNEKPLNINQIRLIHLGKQLENESINQLNLQTSDIIHVTLKPNLNNGNNNTGTSILKKTTSNITKNSNRLERSNQSNNQSSNNNRMENLESNSNDKNGCCIIV